VGCVTDQQILVFARARPPRNRRFLEQLGAAPVVLLEPHHMFV
jgi:hypothetical protein